jgi:2-polyprenyl-6-methoxyphenol hydroxylase-like FAD-dependent oxidoreductase
VGGGGAALALTAGYVLAAELTDVTQDQKAALTAYAKWMRPLVDDLQDLPRGLRALAHPQSRLALALRGLLSKVLMSRPLRPVALKLTQVAETDRELPVLLDR